MKKINNLQVSMPEVLWFKEAAVGLYASIWPYVMVPYHPYFMTLTY